MTKFAVSLTKSQYMKLKRGQTVQLSAQQISPNAQQSHHLILHHETAKKVKKAIAQKKGVRLSLSPEELEASGEGLKEFLQGLKKAGSWVKSNVIDTPFYQQSVRPIVNEAVKTGLQMAAPRLGAAAPLAQNAANEIGKKTGLFGSGMKTCGKRGRAKMIMGVGSGIEMSAAAVRQVMPASDFRPLLKPSMEPSLVQKSQIESHEAVPKRRSVGRGRCSTRGGSFRMS